MSVSSMASLTPTPTMERIPTPTMERYKKHSMELEESNKSFQRTMNELQAEKDNLLARMHAEMAARDDQVQKKDEQIGNSIF